MNQVVYHTIKGWDTPRDGLFRIIVGAWWCVDDDGNPLFYSKANSPQCNQNKDIVDQLARGRKVKQLQVVYIPVQL